MPSPPPTLTINGAGLGSTVLVRPNHPVGVQVSHADAADRVVWIDLANGQPRFSASVNGNPNALVPFTAPDAPGSGLFEVRLLAPNNTVRVVGPKVNVPGNKLPLKPDHSAVDLYDDFDASPAESVRVTIADIGAHQSDWLGLFRVGTPDHGVALQVQTLTGPPSIIGAEYGIYYRVFAAPTMTGQYEIRLFAGDTGIRIARSKKIRVQGLPETPTTLTINSRRFGEPDVPLGPNGPLQVVVAGNPLYATDRVEIWDAGTETAVVPARYLNGQTTPPSSPPVEGIFTMTGPAAPGLYRTVVLRRGENPNAPAITAAYGPSLLVTNTTFNGTDTQFYYSTDAIGSIRVITNAAGSLEARKDYLPFGSEWTTSNSTSQGDRLGFVGKERDPETGLDYFGARYASKDLGRFITVDPFLDLQKALVDPQQWNRFTYVRNSPFRHVDPDGRAIETAFDIISLGISTKAVWQDPTSVWNWISFGADVISIAAPGIPAIGMAIRSGGRAHDIADASKDAFKIASEGGKHANFLRDYAGKPARELSRGIASLEKQIATHLDKIKNPDKYIDGFNKLDPRQRKALLEKKWPGDIHRQQEQRDILKRLLEETQTP